MLIFKLEYFQNRHHTDLRYIIISKYSFLDLAITDDEKIDFTLDVTERSVNLEEKGRLANEAVIIK